MRSMNCPSNALPLPLSVQFMDRRGESLENNKSEGEKIGEWAEVNLQIIRIFLTAMFWRVPQTGNHPLQLASWTAKEDKQVACEIIL